jgi:hypothetical protein
LSSESFPLLSGESLITTLLLSFPSPRPPATPLS